MITKDKKDDDLVKLLQDLVRIPSWVPDDPGEEDLKIAQNENQLVDFLEEWIITNTNLQVRRQPLEGGRYNLIASKGEPKLLFLAHTDTVRPSENAPYDQLAAEIHDGKVWGRGTTDMKSGIATMLQAVQLSPNVDNFLMALYADEEYDFLGMKAFVQDYGYLRPKLIVSSDGSDLQIGHGCRGLIEFRVRITGETGHPARGTGKSAIMASIQAILELRNYLQTYTHPVMGGTSFNIGGFLGGTLQPDSISQGGELKKVAMPGNVVPDAAEFVIDIRPASSDLTPEEAIRVLRDYLSKNDFGFDVIRRKHNYSAWYTDLKDLEVFVKIARESTGLSELQTENPGGSGYLDLQMIWDKVGRPPAFMFGGGEGYTAHKPDEHIKIENLIRTRDFFQKLLQEINRD